VEAVGTLGFVLGERVWGLQLGCGEWDLPDVELVGGELGILSQA